MAIIVEEEKNRSNLATLVGWFVILVVILAAAYYIFLAAPSPAVITPPTGFANITSITQIQFDPTSVVNSASFNSLKQSIPEPTSTGPVSIGRANPFVAP
jgi:hypothetical protein